MFRSDKRNNRAIAAISTLIAAGTTIRGDVHFTGGLHLEGVIEGSIAAEGADAVLTLSEKGKVVGEVRVSNAVVNGTVNGDIHAAERLELAGNTLMVNAAVIGETKLPSGTYTASSAEVAGYVVDSVGGGSVVVLGAGTVMVIR